jgi:hypothetical protein
MKYQQSGEEEVDLQTEFAVTKGRDGVDGELGPVIILELWGGSTQGEYYTMALEEAERLRKQLSDRIADVEIENPKPCQHCGGQH